MKVYKEVAVDVTQTFPIYVIKNFRMKKSLIRIVEALCDIKMSFPLTFPLKVENKSDGLHDFPDPICSISQCY